MNKKFLFILLISLVVVIVGIKFFPKKEQKIVSQVENKETGYVQNEGKTDVATDSGKKLQLPQMEIDKNKKYTAVLKTTKGEIKIELFADKTPITANNFVYLARQNFYNVTIFHRVIKGFMIQGGDPNGDGTGGPGYQFNDEPFEGEYTRGTVAMANAGPNTNGSQFFIMHQDYNLPKNYVIFGQVIEGMEVVDEIAQSATKVSPSGENSIPIEPTVVSSVEIIES